MGIAIKWKKGVLKLVTTYINTEELGIGKIIAEDIYANTKYPIVYKDTKIAHEHLQVFKAFNIEKVRIFSEGSVITKTSQNNTQNKINEIEKIKQELTADEFNENLSKAVDELKKIFVNWEAGSKVDITKVRGIILPLIDQFLFDRFVLYNLNNYSNPKDYLYYHCIATGLLSALITQKLGYEKGFVLQMGIAGTLADCGMAKIPQKTRDKHGSLTEAEFLEIRKHPIYSFQMVKSLPALREEMKLAIYQHHERLDGSGYVEGVKMGKISMFSQIIAVADTFHAMTSERLYRTKESPFKVVEMIKEAEFGKFDIKVTQALTELLCGLTIGTKVELSNLERGEVMFVNNIYPTRPLIKLDNTNEIIDLTKLRSLYISKVLTSTI